VYALHVSQLELQTLVARLEHSGFGQRQTLVAEIARDATREDLAAIVRLLGHDSEAVRIGAIEILEAAGFRQALRHLSAVTVQRQGKERAFAARAVAVLARPEDRGLLEPVVRTWLSQDDPYLQIHANNVCARLGIVVSEDRAPRIETPAAGPVAGITSPDATARKQAIARTVSGLDNPAAALVDGLFDTRSPGVRLDLVSALAGLDIESIVPVLPRIMKKGDGDLLALVARALEPRLDSLSEAQLADVRSALEHGRGRVFDHVLARDAIDQCLARLRRPG
jgi:hypothetical protein